MGKFVRTLWFVFVFGGLFLFVINKFQSGQKENGVDCTDRINTLRDRNSIVQSWRDFNHNSYCMKFQVKHKANRVSENHRQTSAFLNSSYTGYWRDVYTSMYNEDKDKLGFFYEKIDSIQQAEQLNRNAFAEMIVTCIQDIPYVLVLNFESCFRYPEFNGSCIDGQEYGLLSPVEFLHSLMGDCDTRTLLLYTVFKHYGYDPLIMISQEYRHSVLALDLIGRGDHITKHGKRYYFWETTAYGGAPGVLPPDSKDINYWKIALD